MTAYTFGIDSMIQGHHEYQSIWDNPVADGDLLCEQETGNSRDPQAIAISRGNRRYSSCKLLGTWLRKISPINLFNIHMRLYISVKIGW